MGEKLKIVLLEENPGYHLGEKDNGFHNGRLAYAALARDGRLALAALARRCSKLLVSQCFF